MPERPLLILGASGFLGAHLVSRAAAAGRLVVAAARRPEQRPWRERDPRGLVRECALDATGDQALAELVEGSEPRAVISAVALARVADCERDPELATRLNAELPGRLARLCQDLGARLVHVSTDLVFGAQPPRGERFDEQDSTAPLHAYGASKAEGERAVLEAARDALVVRLPLLFGDSGGRGLGASDQVRAAVARGERPFLFRDEFRTPLDVQDAAAALLELLEGDVRGLLHVAGPERLDRLTLGLLALEAAGLSPEAARSAVDAGLRAQRGLGGRPGDVGLDASRARALLRTPLRTPRAALAGLA